MKALLDTCTFLWAAMEEERLSKKARQILSNPRNELFLSAVSAWEIATKHSLGKLELHVNPARWVPDRREKLQLLPLPLAEEACLGESLLPKIHKDPFDRMLICQAIVHGMAILTPDPLIQKYPVKTIW